MRTVYSSEFQTDDADNRVNSVDRWLLGQRLTISGHFISSQFCDFIITHITHVGSPVGVTLRNIRAWSCHSIQAGCQSSCDPEGRR